jgi:DNA-binding LytR/AlgR family response regulator
VLIVEDEPLAVRSLERGLEQLDDVEVVGIASHGRAGLALVDSVAPEVILLDIKMPLMGGLELAEALPRNATPVIIFVTAFNEFAVEAFRLAAVDYLMKPVDPSRLHEAIERARLRVARSTAEDRASELQKLVEVMRATGAGLDPPGAAIWAMGPRGRQRLPVAAIEWFEAQRDYVSIHSGARTFIQRGTLRDLVAKLDPAVFQRVHRSAIVNLNVVVGIERRNWGLFAVKLNTGAEVPVGRSYLPELRAKMERAGIIHIRG